MAELIVHQLELNTKVEQLHVLLNNFWLGHPDEVFELWLCLRWMNG